MRIHERLKARLSPQEQRAIESHPEIYSPLIALMGGYMEELRSFRERSIQIAASQIGRSLNMSVPVQLPAQSLVVPEVAKGHQFKWGSRFHASPEGDAWTPSGTGWTTPLHIPTDRQRLVDIANGDRALLWTIEGSLDCSEPEGGLSRGLLAFVAGKRERVAALARAKWGIRLSGHSFRRIEVERYTGYLEAERYLSEIVRQQGTSNGFWPPAYPFSRRFLHLSPLQFNAPILEEVPDVTSDRIALIAILDKRDLSLFTESGEATCLVLNAVPVVQVQVHSEAISRSLFPIGSRIAMNRGPFSGLCGAVAHVEDRPVSCGLVAKAQSDMENCEVELVTSVEATDVQILHNCRGEAVGLRTALPDLQLSSEKGIWRPLYPAVGGQRIGGSRRDELALHPIWLSRMFAPYTGLTEGEARHLLSLLASCRECFAIERTSLTNEGVLLRHEKADRWDSYLWPFYVPAQGETTSVDQPEVVETLLLRLRPTLPTDMPCWLLEDLAHHVASFLSQFYRACPQRITAEVLWSP